ncbi:MAG: hypothetical protein HKO93_03160 [Flavobacteriales bacterium]|nr:hypothetical protein [Flavobacteriales bacterium]
MIKFFRKIRQRLLKEGKMTRYLAYAIGEIFLVVIGILIALQINNQNELRKVHAQEQNYLELLKEEFSYNNVQLEKVMASNARFGEAAREILNHTGPDEPQISEEEFIRLFMNMLNSEVQYRPSNGVLDEIISSGKLEIFQDPELRKLLSSWDGLIYMIRFQEEEQNSVRMELIDILNEEGNARHMFYTTRQEQFDLTPSKFKNENREILRSIEFENQTMSFRSTSFFANEYYYPKVGTCIDKILQLIDQELEEAP